MVMIKVMMSLIMLKYAADDNSMVSLIMLKMMVIMMKKLYH